MTDEVPNDLTAGRTLVEQLGGVLYAILAVVVNVVVALLMVAGLGAIVGLFFTAIYYTLFYAGVVA
jgi:hypothetical protein